MLSLLWQSLADLDSTYCCQVTLRLSDPDTGSPRFQVVTEMQAGQELFHDPPVYQLARCSHLVQTAWSS